MMTTDDAVEHLKSVPNLPVPGWRWEAWKVARDGERRRRPLLSASDAERASYRDFAGYEYREPAAAEVCAAASLGVDVGVVACVLASEFPTTYPAYLLAGGAALVNDADALFPGNGGWRAADGLLRRATAQGRAPMRFGRQAGDGSARYCSSFQAPTLRTVEAARLALKGVGAEIARGGRRWLDPKVQDGGRQGGEILKHDAEAVLRSRYADGWKLVEADPRIDDYVLAILGREGVSLDAALGRLKAGRERWGRG